MSLSEQERRALREIEQSLLADDPRFGAHVQRAVSVEGQTFNAPAGVTLRGISLLVLGLVMLIGGVALAQHSLWFIALSIAGFVVMFGAGVWMLRSGSNENSRASQGSASARQRQANAGQSSNLGSKMEENFRRRFEN